MKLFKATAPAAHAGVLIGALVFSSSAFAVSWNMPVRSNTSNYLTQNIQQFVEDVEQRTGEELTIQIHPEDALIKQPEVMRAVQTQQVEIGEYLMSMQSNQSPIFAVDSIPFLASTYEANRELAEAARPNIEEELAERNLKLLFIQSWPRQGIYVHKKIEDLDDFTGVTMRAYNPNTARIAELLGATPVTIQQSEVPQAFSTGVIDAMITSPTTGIDTQAWDFVDYFYDVEAFITWNIVVVNQDAFEALDEETQQAVLEASEAAGERAWENAPRVTEEQIATLAENGMTVERPGPELTEELRGIGETMLDEWLADAGEEGKEIIERYRSSQ